jgi:hypothetical protein
MPMVPFYTEFGDLAFKEMRSITLPEPKNGLPAGTYGLLESYCNEPGCDCRSVFLNIVTPEMKSLDNALATVNYGWESVGYYTKWLHGDQEFAREMKGPSISSAMVRQSRLAPALLDLVRYVLEDPLYVKRLKKHYRMFRKAIGRKGRVETLVRSRLKPR